MQPLAKGIKETGEVTRRPFAISDGMHHTGRLHNCAKQKEIEPAFSQVSLHSQTELNKVLRNCAQNQHHHVHPSPALQLITICSRPRLQ
jgi:uncharacterized protein YcbK (DUF882 family)